MAELSPPLVIHLLIEDDEKPMKSPARANSYVEQISEQLYVSVHVNQIQNCIRLHC